MLRAPGDFVHSYLGALLRHHHRHTREYSFLLQSRFSQVRAAELEQGSAFNGKTISAALQMKFGSVDTPLMMEFAALRDDQNVYCDNQSVRICDAINTQLL